MMDPPRETSKPAVEACIGAGIRPVMITGDHKITAAAIAKQVGILRDDHPEELAVDGSTIDGMSDKELEDYVDKVSVYARVTPEHKIRIVRAWQNKGKIVAMTGDGVNDAPALKQADVGVAMGQTGSEVAKDAAAMVLTDDNFATIVKAVEHGRNIYGNIRKASSFAFRQYSRYSCCIICITCGASAAVCACASAVYQPFDRQFAGNCAGT